MIICQNLTGMTYLQFFFGHNASSQPKRILETN